ncbi:MAG TPA: DUF4157 domain-containing protein [Kofleriaceae bacterium]|nr:DUF4157 domain-containing protein [Kofleriaceae bacterium]
MRDYEGGLASPETTEQQPVAPVPGRRSLIDTVQLKADGAPMAGAPLAPASGAGAPLDGGTRGMMERSFGADFSGVRVHQDGAADSLGASAYARGDNLHFGAGKYDPASQGGRELIGHELSHVVQQREGRAATPQGKGGSILTDASLEREADHQGALAAQGLPARSGGSSAASVSDGPVQGRDLPAGQVAHNHAFAIPTIIDLNTIPDAVNRNQIINQTYHAIDAAMTGYLGDPLIANWFTFGQHASREAGTQIRNLQMGLDMLRQMGPMLAGLAFGNPITAIRSARTAIQMIQRILDLMGQDALIRQAIQLAMMRAGITEAELRELVSQAEDMLIAAAAGPLNPVAMYRGVRFIGHVTSVVGKLIVAIPAIIRSLELVYDNMKRGNKEIYENVAPAARQFLLAAQAAPDQYPARQGFAGDGSGFMAAAFAEYVDCRRLGDEARATPGTPEAAQKLAQRHDKVQHANLLIGFQEQLVILQPIFDTMQAELRAMSGTMTLHDPNGAHPLANNWGDFYTRMGIDPATAPPDPRTITPGTIPPLLPAARRRGTIGSYFGDNVDDERVHEAPPTITPG